MFGRLKNLFNSAKVGNSKRATGPVLTDADVTRLVGHNNVVYYNYETGAWNTNKYNGCAFGWRAIDTARALEFKDVMEKEPNFRAQYKMVATVTMTVGKVLYPGLFNMVRDPQYSDKGEVVVGNIIVKDNATGKYELYGNSWVSIGVYPGASVAAVCGAYRFANLGAGNAEFRAALLRAHGHDR